VTPDTHLIDRPDALGPAARRLAEAASIAIDCESDGLHHWKSRLCVLQCALPDGEVFIFDALALPLGEALAPVLSEAGPVKILHDLYFDAWLLRGAGVSLARVVDTSVHARFLGLRATGLATLLGDRCGVTLDKKFQQYDWAKRPLDGALREYLAGDVRHLHDLHGALDAEARERGIADEVVEETAYALRRALRDADDDRLPFARVKGRHGLDPVGRAVLRRLAATREALAEARDLPSGRVLSNAALVDVARRRPRSNERLKSMVQGGLRDDDSLASWMSAVREGEADGDVPADERHYFESERNGMDGALRRRREVALQKWRAEAAVVRGVDVQVVLPGHCLEAIAGADVRGADDLRRIDGIGEVRVLRDGDAIVACLAAA
jgi:ribonuclease D